MELKDLKSLALPNLPGVYLFKRGRTVLYVGKATNLRDRVRSYFDDDLIATRGPRVVDMVTQANGLAFETTPTVLEALVREAALIKKYQPKANVEGKDDKTFLYAVVTKEDLPRVLVVRGKDVEKKGNTVRLAEGKFKGQKVDAAYGPFPSGNQLREGLRLIRRIFPFFDTEKPVLEKNKHQAAKIEFNRQIRQYPRTIDSAAYRRVIRRVKLFLSGRGKELRVQLAREMKDAAAKEHFEEAALRRKELFALDHLQDVSLVSEEGDIETASDASRIEAYDTAHLAGTDAIGVMVVLHGFEPSKAGYRTFRIRGFKKNDDIGSLREILTRRFAHLEWPLPSAIVIDGGKTHKRAAEEIVREHDLSIPVVAVVKDERHRPREVIGAQRARLREVEAVRANSEAHRFSLARHRAARSKRLRSG